jgi:hypothetical protein
VSPVRTIEVTRFGDDEPNSLDSDPICDWLRGTVEMVGGFVGLGMAVAEVPPATHPLALMGDTGLQRGERT